MGVPRFKRLQNFFFCVSHSRITLGFHFQPLFTGWVPPLPLLLHPLEHIFHFFQHYFENMAWKDVCSVKYGALALLVLQNTFLVVFMRYSRTNSGPLYASSTAVAMMELIKFVTCFIVIAHQKGNFAALSRSLQEELLMHPMKSWNSLYHLFYIQSKIICCIMLCHIWMQPRFKWDIKSKYWQLLFSLYSC